jgi:hypothetical protein
MSRAASLGYPTTDTLAATAGLSGRTVWALVVGEQSEFAEGTYTRLEACLLLEHGSLEAAVRARSPRRLRFAAEGDARTGARRREIAALLASAGIARDPGRLRAGASRLRAAAPPRDAELADIAALAELVAAVMDGTQYTRDVFSERLQARSGLTRRDRDVFTARAHRDVPVARPAEDGSLSAIPPVVFQAEG